MTQAFEAFDKIESIRARNNTLWIDILRIAYQKAPGETLRLFAGIIENDREVVALMKSIVDGRDPH